MNTKWFSSTPTKCFFLLDFCNFSHVMRRKAFFLRQNANFVFGKRSALQPMRFFVFIAKIIAADFFRYVFANQKKAVRIAKKLNASI